MDLDYAYDGDTFVLYTDSETIYRSLCKAEHTALIRQAFIDAGVDENGFALRIRGKQAEDFAQSLEKIKQTFNGVKIEVK